MEYESHVLGRVHILDFELFLALFPVFFEIFLGNILDIPGEIFQKSQQKSLKNRSKTNMWTRPSKNQA
jgi:hypothetical protein